jgi:flagellar basal-body rod protein FlgC
MLKIFEVASSAMTAQSQRLNAVASNLANAESASSSKDGVYKAKQVVFQTIYTSNEKDAAGVKVTSVAEDERDGRAMYSPGHPLANESGYVFMPNVNPVEEMANMMSATRSYQTAADVMNSAKSMAQKALALGNE